MSLLLPAVIGICVGIIVGLLGAGGGILSVPHTGLSAGTVSP